MPAHFIEIHQASVRNISDTFLTEWYVSNAFVRKCDAGLDSPETDGVGPSGAVLERQAAYLRNPILIVLHSMHGKLRVVHVNRLLVYHALCRNVWAIPSLPTH